MSDTTAIMFYDGGCALCAREVTIYRRIDRAGLIQFVDISRDTRLLEALDVTPAAAMRRLHVLSPEGVMTTGAYAFATLWRQIPGLRHIANGLFQLRLTKPLDRAYEKFARARYRRRCGTTRDQTALTAHCRSVRT